MTINYIKQSPLSAAQNDLVRLDRAIAGLQAEREKVAAFIEMYDKYAGTGPVSSTPEAAAPKGSNTQSLPLNVRIGNFLAQKLSTVDKPIPIGTIFEMLAPNNLLPGGKDPKQAVSAILGRDSRFKYLQGEGWSLVRQPTFQQLGGEYKAP